MDTPCKIEAAGACDPRPAGTTSEPLVREADSSDGDVERYQMPGDNGVMPSGGVAFGDCVGVLVPPLVSPAQTAEAKRWSMRKHSVEAASLPQWFGGGVPLDGGLRCIIGVPGEAGLKEQGATIREEMLLDGVRKVGILGLPCLRSELHSHRAGIT